MRARVLARAHLSHTTSLSAFWARVCSGWFGFNGGSALAADYCHYQHQHCRSGCRAGLDVLKLAGSQTQCAWDRYRSGGGAGGDYPGFGVCHPLGRNRDRGSGSTDHDCAIRFRQRHNLDESLDVWACHGMGGTWGALATGLFATTTVNAAGANGLFYGNPGLLVTQLITVVVTITFAFSMTQIIARLLNKLMGLRVSDKAEEVGLDISEHGEQAYA